MLSARSKTPTPPETPAPAIPNKRAIISRRKLSGELEDLVAEYGTGDKLRPALIACLRKALAEGRAEVRRRFDDGGSGEQCVRENCYLADRVVGTLADFTVRFIFPTANPTSGEVFDVAATGGYGRGELAPFSDIDLLFLLPYKRTPRVEQVVEYMLYILWDLGLKVGHAVRSVDDCIRQSKADVTIRTAILESRYLWGPGKLFAELRKRYDKEVVAGSGPEFVEAKLAERDNRHLKMGDSRYVLEPNLKDGKGGLRDLQTLFWIAKYLYRVEGVDELVGKKVLTPEEAQRFAKAQNFLWTARCHLHYLTGRLEDRLTFDVQTSIGAAMGYTDHAGTKGVERFMKHYFLVAKDVGDLTAILSAELEVSHAKGAPVLSRVMSKLRPVKRKQLGDSKDFIAENNRILCVNANVFKRDPVNLIRIFHLAQKHNLALHPDAMHAMTRSLKLIDAKLRDSEEANQLFLDILTSKRDPETVLRRMNEAGVLGRFVPAFGKVVAMMQFNMYHHYTVDEHLLRCIGVLSEMEEGAATDAPLANELIQKIKPASRTLLYVAMFLHDIAKGRPEDHSIAGARIARRLCPRLGLSAADTATVAWLIEQHLVMSTVAQSRDLSDRKTIENFAAVVQSVERLKLLTILTIADIKAVGPGVWNGWKAQLVRTLYFETEPVLTGGFSEVNRAQRVAAAQAEFRHAMQSKQWPAEKIEAHIARLYPAYWLKVDLEHKIEHADLLRSVEASGNSLATAIRFDMARAVTELTVLAPDHPWLLSIIAGACAMAGGNIVDAQIFTTTDGQALDTISLSREFERDDDEQRRADRIASSIEKALRGELRLPDVVARRAPPKGRIKAFSIEPGVDINNQWSHRYTMVEIVGLDRPGLLYELTATLSKLNLNIASAHVATFGERAVDVFYVTDLMGAQITSPTRQAAIKRALIALFARPDARPGKGAA